MHSLAAVRSYDISSVPKPCPPQRVPGGGVEGSLKISRGGGFGTLVKGVSFTVFHPDISLT